MPTRSSCGRTLVAVLLLLFASNRAGAGPRPEFDASAGLRPAAAARAQAARARASVALTRLATPSSLDSRYDVPTLLWAVRAKAPVVSALRSPRGSVEAVARRHLGEVAGFYGLEAGDVSEAPLRDVHDIGRGGVLVSFRQAVDGIPVFRDEVKVLMDRGHELVAVSGYIPSRAMIARSAGLEFRLPAERALRLALEDFAGQAPRADAIRQRPEPSADGLRFDISDAVASWPDGLEPAGPVRVRKTLFHMPDVLVPAWQVELMSPDQAYLYVLDAADGRVLFRHDIMAFDSFSYRVWAETTGARLPHDGPQGTGPSPHPTGLPDFYAPGFVSPDLLLLQNGPISTNDPWLAPGATQTQGNNVDAYVDLVSPDGLTAGDFRATTTAANTFDRTYDVNLAPGASGDQRMAAITQLFYDNNFFHDWYYDSGFDELSGNGQANNFGRGGLGGDAMRSEAQDYGGTNNANMSTPPDGSPGRMQMYVFNPTPFIYMQVNAPGGIAGTYAVGISTTFGPQSFNVTGDLVLGADAIAPVNDGCSALVNAVAGKIVLLDRGTCGFPIKAQAAQNAGALGVIIADNVSGSTPPGMGGVLAGITIPTLSVTLATGNTLKTALGSGTVNVQMYRQPSLQRDGTIDNQVVAHEWGHFISNRLIGDAAGLSTNMSGGLGEGWADFHALLLTARPEDILVGANANWNGTYGMGCYALYPSLGSSNVWYFGIRRCPYSSDLNKNGLTFKHIQAGVALPIGPPTAYGQDGSSNAEVHRTGEVWCNMLWECYTSLLRDNIRLTFAEAQQRMRDYLVLGYKLTPNAPTLLEARDALLLAAYTNDVDDFHAFWGAFAKRGAGAGAVAPDRYAANNIPVVESFVTGGMLGVASRQLFPSYRDCDSDGYLDNGEVGTFLLTLKNNGSESLSNTTVTLSSSNPHVSFPAGNTRTFPSMAPFGSATVSVPMELTGASGPEFVDVTGTYNDPGLAIAGPYATTATILGNVDEVPSFTESVETLSPPWASAGTPVGDGEWSVIEVAPGDHRFHGDDYGNISDHTLTSPPLAVGPTGSFSFSFTHSFSFEASGSTYYDGGVVELSTDGGANWTDIGFSLSTLYGGTLYNLSGNPLGGRGAYVANSPGYPALVTTTASLGTTYQGQTVRVRFRVATDAGVGGPGWHLSTLTFNNLVSQPFRDLGPDAGDCASVSVGPDAPRELSFALAGSNPSPGQPSFRFGLPVPADVELSLYDVTGRRVATLVDGEQPAGWQTRTWAANDDGSAPSSGIYFARMRSGRKLFTSRVVITR